MGFDIAFDFLKKLNKNNNREWFEKNKAKYIEVKDFFDAFVSSLLDEMIKFDTSLVGQDPKKLTFRIYRDIRFSKDKTPYKKNISAAFSSVGKGMGKPGYYLHIEPGNKSFVAVGIYMPIPEYLSKIRQEIDYNGDKLDTLFKNKKFANRFRGFWTEDALKTTPKGYSPDHPYIQWLKLKSFIVNHNFSDIEVVDKKFSKNVLEVMRTAKPLNDFLTEAIT